MIHVTVTDRTVKLVSTADISQQEWQTVMAENGLQNCSMTLDDYTIDDYDVSFPVHQWTFRLLDVNTTVGNAE
jgi:hypothetical protein